MDWSMVADTEVKTFELNPKAPEFVPLPTKFHVDSSAGRATTGEKQWKDHSGKIHASREDMVIAGQTLMRARQQQLRDTQRQQQQSIWSYQLPTQQGIAPRPSFMSQFQRDYSQRPIGAAPSGTIQTQQQPYTLPPPPPAPISYDQKSFADYKDAPQEEGFRTVLPVRSSDKVFIEPAPLWDGIEPEKHWKRKRRDVVQWRFDQLAPPEMLGTRWFRATTGTACTIAERITDEQLRTPKGVETLLECFDEVYAAFMVIEDDKVFDDVFYGMLRKANEPMVPWIVRKLDCFLKCEAQGGVLPSMTKGKLMMRHANLVTHQEAKVTTWLEGNRDLNNVMGKLKQLDIEDLQWAQNRKGPGNHLMMDEMSQSFPVFPSASGSSQEWPPYGHSYPTMPEAVTESYESFLVDEDTPQAVSPTGDWELMLYHEEPIDQEHYADERADEGIDGQDEGFVWLSGPKMQKNWTEPEYQQTMAQFGQVRNDLHAKRLGRGFFRPAGSGDKGGHHGKDKGKNRISSKGKGPFTSKGGKGKKKFHFGKGQNARDGRRFHRGITRFSKGQVESKVECSSFFPPARRFVHVRVVFSVCAL